MGLFFHFLSTLEVRKLEWKDPTGHNSQSPKTVIITHMVYFLIKDALSLNLILFVQLIRVTLSKTLQNWISRGGS